MTPKPSFFLILQRGLRKKCPRCGRGDLFTRFSDLNRQCAHCRWKYETHEGDTWAFMYITTALITGFFLIVILWIWSPQTWLGRLGLGLAALGVFFATWPPRKGLAVAFNYWLDPSAPENLPPPRADDN